MYLGIARTAPMHLISFPFVFFLSLTTNLRSSIELAGYRRPVEKYILDAHCFRGIHTHTYIHIYMPGVGALVLLYDSILGLKPRVKLKLAPVPIS